MVTRWLSKTCSLSYRSKECSRMGGSSRMEVQGLKQFQDERKCQDVKLFQDGRKFQYGSSEFEAVPGWKEVPRCEVVPGWEEVPIWKFRVWSSSRMRGSAKMWSCSRVGGSSRMEVYDTKQFQDWRKFQYGSLEFEAVPGWEEVPSCEAVPGWKFRIWSSSRMGGSSSMEV